MHMPKFVVVVTAELSVRSSEHPPLNGNQVSADLNGASGEVEVASPSLASRILPVGFRIRNLVRRGNQYSRLLDSEGQNLTGRLLEDGITTASTIVVSILINYPFIVLFVHPNNLGDFMSYCRNIAIQT